MDKALLVMGALIVCAIPFVMAITILDLWLWRQDRKARGRA